MAAKLLKQREIGHDYYFQVHLDDTKLRDKPGQTPRLLDVQAEDGSAGAVIDPDWQAETELDPTYLREWTFGKEPPEGVKPEAYYKDCLAEVKRQVEELCRRHGLEEKPDEGKAMGEEGVSL